MCFSASASFGAGVVLSAIGIASVKKAQKPSQLAFASVPLLFSAQQITEGFLWLALTNPAYAPLQNVTTYTFLFFAQVVWPIWVPYAIVKLVPKERRNKSGLFLIGVGMLVSLYLGYCLLFYPVKAIISERHISYLQDYPKAISHYCGFLYIIATIAPAYFSPVKHMWTFGTAILISYIITHIFYTDYIVSVWCFFASIISVAVYAILHKINISEPIPDAEVKLKI